MGSMEPQKLLQLRAKTDRQLLEFLHSKLKTGLNCAGLAARLYSEGNLASAAQWLGRGDEALNEVQILLPVVAERHRRELDPKLNMLRESLERLRSRGESTKSRAAMGVW